jgi:hypothetical protein
VKRDSSARLAAAIGYGACGGGSRSQSATINAVSVGKACFGPRYCPDANAMVDGKAGIPDTAIFQHESLLLRVLEIEIGKVDLSPQHAPELGPKLDVS